MRFSLSSWAFQKWSLAHAFDGWVHSSISPGREEFSEHARFIALTAATGICAVALAPFWLAFGGLVTVDEIALLCLATLPIIIAIYVSRTARLNVGHIAFLLVIASFVSLLSINTGGIGSPALWLFCILPIEAALWGERRSLIIGVLASVIGATIVAATSSGILPANNIASPAIGANAILAIVAIAYACVLACRLLNLKSSANASLHSADARMRLIVENTAELITRHDRGGATQFASAAARNLVGVSASELLNSGMVEKIHLQDRIIFLKSISDAAQTGRDQVCEMRIRCKGGENRIWKWVEARLRPIVDGAAGQTSVVAITRDISHTKELEDAVAQSAVKSEELGQAQRRFLATMSHELRTPLNAIVGFSDILKQELFGQLPYDRHREYVSFIQDSGQHLLNVVNDLLDMSRIEAGRYELSLSTFPITEVAKATINMLHPIAAKGNISVVYDASAALPDITADRRACQQIMINLVSNAIKFSGKGGNVRVSMKQHGRSLKLRVKDNGIGIAPDFLPSLGQPFMQADNGTDRKFEGSGLGLSVVNGLVALHSGDINIQSVKGEGTTVTITLPISAPHSRPKPADETTQLVHIRDIARTNQLQTTTVNHTKGDRRARVSA